MESPSKVSIKRLESNVQRERNIASEWENKYKEAEKEKADMMQSVVDLRRELISLNNKVKKNLKLEERLTIMSKELESCQKTIAEQRNNLLESKEEMERVRFNANESISKWKQAELQWLSNTECLKNQLSELEQEMLQQKKMDEEYAETVNELNEKLNCEQRINEQVKTITTELEQRFKEAMQTINSEQNKTYSLQENLQNLERVNDHFNEELRRKETEIELLRAECNKHGEQELKWNNMEAELIGKINAEKVASGRAVALYETVSVDLENAKKENYRLTNIIETLSRKVKLNEQNETTLVRKISEFKEKYEQMQEAYSKKTVEVREKELAISQLELSKKKLESAMSNFEFDSEKLSKERQLLQTNYNALVESKTELEEERRTLLNELSEMRSKYDKAEEEMVLIKTELEEKIQRVSCENRILISHVEERQHIVDDLTNELAKSNESTSEYRNLLVKKEEKIISMNYNFEKLMEELKFAKLTAAVNEELFKKSLDANNYYLSQNEIWHNALLERCHFFGEANDIMCQVNKELRCELLRHSEQESRQQIFMEEQAAILEMKYNECALYISIARTMQEKNTFLAAKLTDEQERAMSLTSNIAQLRSDNKEFQLQQFVIQSNLADINEKLMHQVHEFKNEQIELERLSALEMEWWRLFNEIQTEYNMFSVSVTIDAIEQAHLCKVVSLTEELKIVKTSLTNEIEDKMHFVREAKQSIEQERTESLCQLRKLIGHNAELKKNFENCEQEKEELQKQVNELIHWQRCHQQFIDKLHEESSERLLKNEAMCNELKSEIEKSEKRLKYEIDRKEQYKNAFIQLKKLRLELEECRQKEKALAITAVKKANEETQYWRDSFEKLKLMISEKNHNNEILPLKPICANVSKENLNANKKKLTEQITVAQSESLPRHTNENNNIEEDSKMCAALKRPRSDSVEE